MLLQVRVYSNLYWCTYELRNLNVNTHEAVLLVQWATMKPKILVARWCYAMFCVMYYALCFVCCVVCYAGIVLCGMVWYSMV